MKKKFIIFTLCFTLIFSSLNYKKTYADGGVISLPMLATVSALAVGSGIIINNNDDLYDLGRMFYDYVKASKDLTWDIVKIAFNSSVAVLNNGLVSVDSKFLDIVKGFFDYSVATSNGNTIFSSYFDDGKLAYVIDTVDFTDIPRESGRYKVIPFDGGNIYIGHYDPVGGNSSSNSLVFSVQFSDGSFGRNSSSGDAAIYKGIFTGLYYIGDGKYKINYISRGSNKDISFKVSNLSFIPSIPYEGNYTWDNVDSKKENESISLPIPGNLGQLVGQGSTDFWDNTDNLVGGGNLSLPNVDNPSIGLDGSTSFPGTGSDVQTVCSECGLVGTHSSTCSKVNTDNPPIGLPEFPSWGSGIDFSPITESDISDKFPFCLAKDLSNLISVFDVGEKEPVFNVPFLGEVYTIDLAQFTVWADIIKFFTLITFIFGLIKITRGIIG